MAKKKRKAVMYLVIQVGGPPGDDCLHGFATQRGALNFIRRAETAGRDCSGPFPFELPGDPELAAATRAVILTFGRRVMDPELFVRFTTALDRVRGRLELN